MEWIVLGKLALIAFLVAGCAILVITYIRKARRGGLRRVEASQYGYLAAIRGSMPPMPLPEWADWDDENGENFNGGRLGRQSALEVTGRGRLYRVLAVRCGTACSASRTALPRGVVLEGPQEPRCRCGPA